MYGTTSVDLIQRNGVKYDNTTFIISSQTIKSCLYLEIGAKRCIIFLEIGHVNWNFNVPWQKWVFSNNWNLPWSCMWTRLENEWNIMHTKLPFHKTNYHNTFSETWHTTITNIQSDHRHNAKGNNKRCWIAKILNWNWLYWISMYDAWDWIEYTLFDYDLQHISIQYCHWCKLSAMKLIFHIVFAFV